MCCINFSSQFLPTHNYSRRTRRITYKWRTLLSRDVTAMKQFTCLNSDYSCSTRNKWLLVDQHQIRSVDSAALSADGANPSIARDIITARRTSSYACAVLAVVILSVCQSVRLFVTHVPCDKTKQWTHCRYFDTIRKGNHSSFLTPTVIGGWRPLLNEISAQSDQPPSKHADFDRFLLITSQP